MSIHTAVLGSRTARILGVTVAVVTGMLVGLFLALCFVVTSLDLLG